MYLYQDPLMIVLFMDEIPFVQCLFTMLIHIICVVNEYFNLNVE